MQASRSCWKKNVFHDIILKNVSMMFYAFVCGKTADYKSQQNVLTWVNSTNVTKQIIKNYQVKQSFYDNIIELTPIETFYIKRDIFTTFV